MQRTVPGVEFQCSTLVGRIRLNDVKINRLASIQPRKIGSKKSVTGPFMRYCCMIIGRKREMKNFVVVPPRVDQERRA